MLDLSAEALRSASLLPDDAVAAFCVGSTARGWANERSDIDLIVVSTTLVATQPGDQFELYGISPSRIVARGIEELGCDVRYFTLGQFDQLLAKADPGPGLDPFRVETFSIAEELILERFVDCLPLLGQEWVRSEQERLRLSDFLPQCLARSFRLADKYIEDAIGFLDEGDTLSSLVSTKSAWGHCVDASLESIKVFGAASPKWRPRRLRDASGCPVSLEEYTRVELMTGADPSDIGPWIMKLLERCRELQVDIDLDTSLP